MLERVSIEVTNRCGKACWFCYNSSGPAEVALWTGAELVSFARSCVANGVKAISFGGGEPMEFPELFDVLRALDGYVYRSVTTNGLHLDCGEIWASLLAARPDKVHVSIHFPERPDEVDRVLRQVCRLQTHGIASGVNLVVSRANAPAAERAAATLREGGLDNRRIVYLPMRGGDTPDPTALARVAGGAAFQSMTCLKGCAKSSRFASVGWDKTVAWCSYTSARAALPELTWACLTSTLAGLGVTFCGGTE